MSGVQQALIDELRLCAGGAAPTMRELRLQLGCSPGELAGAVQALRYAGKLSWDGIALSSSMLAGDEPAPGPAVAPIAAEGGTASSAPAAPPSGPDDEEDPGVNDAAQQRGKGGLAPGGFVPKPLPHKAGVHTAATRAASRPVPAPRHEPEIARQVREEVEDIRSRRRAANSTATVSHPLELRKFGVPDMSFAEGVVSLLAETPADLMTAIGRKHPKLWRRVILLGRARGERTAQALYAALEAGLDALEPQTEPLNRKAA